MADIITVTLNPALDKAVALGKLNVGGLNRVKGIRSDPGGKGINVARVLKQLGADVTAAGLIGGVQGELILKKLEEAGISSEFLKVDGETRVNLKIFEEETGEVTEINESGFFVTKEELNEFGILLSSILQDASFLVLSGSIPLGVNYKIYREYISMSNAKGVKAVLDADGQALEEGIKAVPYALKPNIKELEALFGYEMGDDKDILSAAKELISTGISMVIVSKGAEGAVVVDCKEAFRTYPFAINPISATGSGDSMVAALVYACLNKMSLYELSKWITAAGTITASKPGTQLCSLDEIRQSYNRIKIEKL